MTSEHNMYISYPAGGGIMIKDTISNQKMIYFFYTKRQAITKHRRDFGLVGKHFNIIE